MQKQFDLFHRSGSSPRARHRNSSRNSGAPAAANLSVYPVVCEALEDWLIAKKLSSLSKAPPRSTLHRLGDSCYCITYSTLIAMFDGALAPILHTGGSKITPRFVSAGMEIDMGPESAVKSVSGRFKSYKSTHPPAKIDPISFSIENVIGFAEQSLPFACTVMRVIRMLFVGIKKIS